MNVRHVTVDRNNDPVQNNFEEWLSANNAVLLNLGVGGKLAFSFDSVTN